MTRKTKTMQEIQEAGTRIAPAVALLLLSDSVQAADSEDQIPPIYVASEPSTLGLLATCAAVGGVAAYIRSKRRK